MSQVRRNEDAASLCILGADHKHGTIQDCIYRTDENGTHLYQSEAELFGSIDPSETATESEVADLLKKTLSVITADFPALYAPLAIGNHVDHQLINQATLRAIDAGDLNPEQVWFYEDYPHHETFPWEPSNRMVSELVPTSGEQHQARADAIAAHESQISTFWKNQNELREQLTARWERYGQAERYWQLT